MTAPAHTKAAAKVLAAHEWWPLSGTCECGWGGATAAEEHPQHQADELARAGLLADPDALAKAFCCDWSGCPGDHLTADNYCTARRRYGTEESSDD